MLEGTSFGAGGGEDGQGGWVVRVRMQVERDSDEASAAAFYPFPTCIGPCGVSRNASVEFFRVEKASSGVVEGGLKGLQRGAKLPREREKAFVCGGRRCDEN